MSATRSAADPRTARNAPCGCESGLRYKHCCGLVSVSLPGPEDWAAQELAYEEAQACFVGGDTDGAQSRCLAILAQEPGHIEALKLLARLRTAEGKLSAAQALLLRSLELDPRDEWLMRELASLYARRNELRRAAQYGRDAIRLDPLSPHAHNVMGIIFTNLRELGAGEYHFRKALELNGPADELCANLALNLAQQGEREEADRYYREALALDPENPDSLLGWARLSEARRDLERAGELLERVEAANPAHPGLPATRSLLHRRHGRFEEALAALDEVRPADGTLPDLVDHYHERGVLLEELERYDQAFEAFALANAALRASGSRTYDHEGCTHLAARLKGFLDRRTTALLPRATALEPGRSRPVFVVGFPCSGAGLVAEMLASGPNVLAREELDLVPDLIRVGQQMVGSELAYPHFLADLWLGKNQGVADNLRDYYLERAEQVGASDPRVPWFVDARPLNEMHLGLIHLVFPSSPVIHVVRHPLDAVLSCFFDDLAHGDNCSYALDTAAYHYALTGDLVQHYRDVLDLDYLEVRYEDIVEQREPNARKLLSFIGEHWDEHGMHIDEDRGEVRTVGRYKHYRKHLEPLIPVLGPTIGRLGYEIG